MEDRTAVARPPSTGAAPIGPVVTARIPGPRTPDEIERDIEATRARLAGTIDELGYRVKPATIAKRSAEKAKAAVIDENGAPRTSRIAVLGGAVATVLAIMAWRRRS